MGKGSRKAQGTRQDPGKGLEAEEHQEARESDEKKGMFKQRAPGKICRKSPYEPGNRKAAGRGGRGALGRPRE